MGIPYGTEYTITELTPAKYSLSISGNDSDTLTESKKVIFTNTAEYVSIPVVKVWEDNKDQDGKRPNMIEVILTGNGTEVARATLSGTTDTWSYTFEDLPKYDNGVEIKYQVEEIKVEEYTVTIDGYNIKNTYTPKTTKSTIVKDWNDKDDAQGKRPDSVTMKLYANNANTGIWVKLGESYSNSGFTGIYAEVSIEIDSKSATLFNLPLH